MNRVEKEGLIARYETTYKPVQELVNGLSKEERSFVPNLPDAWSIDEHLVHLLEADALCWFRARVSIAEPGAKGPSWNQESWRSRLRYWALDGLAWLEDAVRIRGFIAETCRAVLDDDWSVYWFEHPARGRMELRELLELYCGHADFHIPYMERNLKALRG